MAPAPVYLVVDPDVAGYNPVLAAYPSRDEARADLRALTVMSAAGVVQIREFTGRERTGTWNVTLRDGELVIKPTGRRG